ncbi:MAG TPA: hypothetical protein PLQ19_00630 [Aeromicrobium sp.]|nr:hypothetical protein [Aeromicrobium sp.]
MEKLGKLNEMQVNWRIGHRACFATGAKEIPQVMMMRPSLADLIGNADRLADAFEDLEPTDADFGAPLPPLMAVKLAAFRRAAAEKELAEAIAVAREASLSWRELGEAIGTTGEAVRQRYTAS